MALFELSNPLSGSTYFFMETVRNNDGFYDSTIPKYALGRYQNFISASQDTLVSSPYMFGVVVPPGSSSFEFAPDIAIPTGSVYLRATFPTSLELNGELISPAQLNGSGYLMGFDLPALGLLDLYPGAAAAYSLRTLDSEYSGSVVRVRRDSDNAEQDFTATEITDGTLEDWVNSRDSVAPADYGSGAAAAYSLRYVSDSYTGSVVRVRRDSDNAEQDFTPSQITDGTLAAFVGAGNNGYVTTWYDQSGNGNDATQSTAANQPKIYDSSTGLVLENGKPALDFDGIDDNLLLNSFYANKFFFSVVGRNNRTTDGSFISGGDDVNNRFDFGARTSSDTRILVSEDGSTERIETAIDYTGAQRLFIANNTTLSIDGSVVNTGLINSDILAYTNNLTIGARTFSTVVLSINGNLQEIIIYRSDQSSNRTNIEQNINDFYSIYTPSVNGYVTTWYDQSGNSNDATQSTAANQPKIYDSVTGLVLENGKPALDFDGVDDELQNSGINSVDWGFFSVLKIDETEYNTLFCGIFGIGITRGFMHHWSAGYGYFSDTYNGLVLRAQTTYGQHSLSILIDSTTGSGYVNSVSGFVDKVLTSNPGYTLTTVGYDLFKSTYKGVIQEIIIYPSDQSSNRTNIEQNINNHYNIY